MQCEWLGVRFDFKLTYVLTGDANTDKRTRKLAMARLDQLRGRKPPDHKLPKHTHVSAAVAAAREGPIQPAECPLPKSDEQRVSSTSQPSPIESFKSSDTRSQSATGSEVSKDTHSRSLTNSLDSRDKEREIDSKQSSRPSFGDRRVPSVQVAVPIVAIEAIAQGVGTEQTGGAAPVLLTSRRIQSTSSAQADGINTFPSAAVSTHTTFSRGPSPSVDLCEWIRLEPSSRTSMSSERNFTSKDERGIGASSPEQESTSRSPLSFASVSPPGDHIA